MPFDSAMPVDSVESAPHEASSSSGIGFAAFWAVASAAALIALYVRHRHASLDGDFQGWASASCMVMARAFNQLGALHTHFVPFQNNLPVGLDPDVYLHWPPLYPLVLSVFLRVFGDAPNSGRALALLICLGCGGLVLLIAKRLYSLRVGLLAVFFYFTARATYEGASPLLQQPLAMLFALLAVYCFLRAVGIRKDAGAESLQAVFAVVGVVAMMLTIASAWDPVFIPFGLLATAIWLRHRAGIRLGVVYCVATVLTFVGIEADYVLSYPKLFANQFATIAYRAGMHFNGASSVRLHTIVDRQHFDVQLGLIASYWRALRWTGEGFSTLTLVGCCVFVALCVRGGGARRDASSAASARASVWLTGGLLLPVVVWYLVMRNYVAIHSFVLVLAAPFVAIASAFVLDALWANFSSGAKSAMDRPLYWTLAIALPLIVLQPLLLQYRDAEQQGGEVFRNLSAVIKDNTPATAVVLTPAESLVPTYYSERHLVRGIESDAWLVQATEEAHRDFPGASLYFAMQLRDAALFPAGFGDATVVARQGDAVLYALR